MIKVNSIIIISTKDSLSNCRIITSFFFFTGVESYDIDLKEQKVVVKGNVEPDTVLKTVSKTGKPTAFWEAEAPSETKAQ